MIMNFMVQWVGTTVLYSRGPGFKPRRGDQLPRQILHGFPYSPQAHAAIVLYIKLSHAFLVSRPIQFFI
jgi:hypothetical protein